MGVDASQPWWDPALRRLVAGRRVILAGGVPPAWTATHDALRDAGAAEQLVLATEGPGVGPVPDCEIVVAKRPDGLSMMARIRRSSAVLRALPADLAAAVERFDPDGTAVVLGTFLNDVPSVLGRPFVNHREPAWVALEDKVVVDQLWAACGVPTAPHAVVAVPDAREAAARLDQGAGTVWAGDATSGWHGGAAFTRWIVDEEAAAEAEALFAPSCERVRVMPFLEGIPCSVHGVVFPDGVAALRPVEMVTLRRDRELFYAGCATFWDPPDAVREAMRDSACRVGEHLAGAVGYRGAFTIDGVVTADGFRPTELNPRAGAGLTVISRVVPDGMPLLLLVDLVAGGVDIGAGAASFEREVLTAADERRAGGTWRFDPAIDPADWEGTAWDRRGGWTRVEPTEPCGAADVVAHPGATRCAIRSDTWPAGPSVAPAAAAFYAFVDRELGASIGPLTPAVDVTRQ